MDICGITNTSKVNFKKKLVEQIVADTKIYQELRGVIFV